MKTIFSKSTSLIICIVASLTLPSCKKEKDETHPTPAPAATFTVSSPEEGKEYHHGMTIPITATISAASEMHGFEATITNTTTEEIVFEIHQHAHGEIIILDTSWTNNVAEHSSMVLVIEAVIDHDGTIESKTVSFHCHPEMGGTH